MAGGVEGVTPPHDLFDVSSYTARSQTGQDH